MVYLSVILTLPHLLDICGFESFCLVQNLGTAFAIPDLSCVYIVLRRHLKLVAKEKLHLEYYHSRASLLRKVRY